MGMRYYYPDVSLIGQDKSEEERKKLFVNFYSRVYYFLNINIALEKRIEKTLTDIIVGEKSIKVR